MDEPREDSPNDYSIVVVDVVVIALSSVEYHRVRERI